MIEGGYILQPRVIQESDISVSPPYVREIWSYLLREANSKDNKYNGHEIKRGQLFRSYNDIREGTKWYIGWRKMMYNENHAKKAMKFLRDTGRITTQKEPGGVLITICKYEYYQDPKNYERTKERTNGGTIAEPLQNQPLPDNNKNDKNDKNKKKEESKKAAPVFSASDLKEMFDVFRKKHGGKGKRSLDVEFEHFKKKHKDWREVIPTLPDIIDKHIEYRKRLESTGEFVANWKNFSTWVNNRCWTEELEPIESKTTSNGQLPIDFKPEVEYFIQGKGGVEKMVNKETRLTITGHARKEYRDGEMRYADEQGRLITEQEYNEKIQLQTH